MGERRINVCKKLTASIILGMLSGIGIMHISLIFDNLWIRFAFGFIFGCICGCLLIILLTQEEE